MVGQQPVMDGLSSACSANECSFQLKYLIICCDMNSDDQVLLITWSKCKESFGNSLIIVGTFEANRFSPRNDNVQYINGIKTRL